MKQEKGCVGLYKQAKGLRETKGLIRNKKTNEVHLMGLGTVERSKIKGLGVTVEPMKEGRSL